MRKPKDDLTNRQKAAVVLMVVGPELARDGQEGLLVAPGDAGALRAAIGRLNGDAELAVTMGRAGRARAELRFAPQSHLDTIQSIYDRARTRIREAS